MSQEYEFIDGHWYLPRERKKKPGRVPVVVWPWVIVFALGAVCGALTMGLIALL